MCVEFNSSNHSGGGAKPAIFMEAKTGKQGKYVGDRYVCPHCCLPYVILVAVIGVLAL